MGSEWAEVKLGSVTDLLTGFPFKSSEYVDSPNGIRLLRGDNIAQGALRWDGVKRLPRAALMNWPTYELKIGDVVLAMDRPWIDAGLKFAAVHASDVPTLLVQRVARLRGSGRLETSFLKYIIGSAPFTKYVLAIQTGTAVPHISGDQIRSYTLTIPPLSEQRAISHILGTLDDRIDANRRMAATLEEMARALFRAWFVTFEPVRAKMEGRWQKGQSLPGLPASLYDLFPDRLVETEHCEIPEGWALEPLSHHVEVTRGVSYQGDGLGDRGVPLHNLNSIREGGGYKYEGIKYYDGTYKPRHVVRPGDVIIANTEQGHDRLLIGYAAIVPKIFGELGIASHHVYWVTIKLGSPFRPAFLVATLNARRMHDVVSGYANGTTVNMLPEDGLQMPLAVVPPPALIESFNALARNSEERGEGIIAGTRTLTALRDSLLPKLVSGMIRVKDAEAFLKARGL